MTGEACRQCSRTVYDDGVPVCEVCLLCEECHDHPLTVAASPRPILRDT